MKKLLFLLLVTLLPLTTAFADPESNYENKTLIPRFQPFVGYHYYENGSSEKLIYSVFTGPSPELTAKLKLFPESSSNFDAINGNLLWGHLTFWGFMALVPLDIALLTNNPDFFARTPTGSSIYFGILVVALVGESASGIFFNQAANLTELDVWKYNKAVTFRSDP